MESKEKSKYLIRNWKHYNKALVNRGSIIFWVEKDALENWIALPSKRRGRPFKYSDDAIRMALVIRAVYHLPFRALQGFMISLLSLLGFNLPCPDYTVFCKRAARLKIPPLPLLKNESLTVIFDSTGLKVFGEGEWKVRKHGYSKRRTWINLHIGIEANTQEIVVAAVSDPSVADSQAMPGMMDVISDLPVESVIGDGAYDTHDCHDVILEKKAMPIIPPRRGARVQRGKKVECFRERDRSIQRIVELGEEGRSLWKKEIGYHRRSLIETAMFRLKTIFGDRLKCRKGDTQTTEAMIRCHALNQMTRLGMPISEKVT